MSRADKKAFFWLGAIVLLIISGIAWAVTGHWWGILVWLGYMALLFAPAAPGVADLLEQKEADKAHSEELRQKDEQIGDLKKQLADGKSI